MSIEIINNTALVHFYGYWLIEDRDGKPIESEDKRFEVFQKIGGKWTFVGGMTAPVEADD
ncbi:MAG: hypothetical protein JSU96_08510 [Acidobacteriota bacterium]|nr:MAG: hypothetical protein JSU96_08510 [Acidobacteriota bacterium]